jgi:protein-tyrosine phosphatase
MSWLSDRQRHGGIDRIEITGHGTLWLCGKHFVGPDPTGALASVGAGSMVCLNEEHELADRYPNYVDWLRSDPRARWFPIPDLGAPTPAAMRVIVEIVVNDLNDAGSAVVHCGAGIGRAGTVAVCALMSTGMDVSSAITAIARARPGAGPESGPQRELVALIGEHGFSAY